MPISRVNGVRIAWEAAGKADSPVLLLIQGLGMPAAAWPPAFLDRLTDAGFRVVTFDNRDIGASELMDHLGRPGVLAAALKRLIRFPVAAPYSLLDMAADAEALLRELSIDKAHVLGVSMGGMIAQNLAITAPDRVLSLTSIMSTTNDRDLPQPAARVQRFMVRGADDNSEAGRRAYHRQLWPLIGSPGYPATAEELENFIDRIFAAGMPPSGRDRQTVAVIAEAGRGNRLQDLSVPTLVIHGDADPLVPVACGRRTADRIPRARLVEIPGMGHDLPAALIPQLSAAIIRHVNDAETERRKAA